MRGKPPADANAVQIVAFVSLQFEAAKAAAPYIHPRLAAVEHKGPKGGPIQHDHTLKVSPEEAYKMMLEG